MTKFIIRINTGTRGALSQGVRFGTVQAEDLKARFPDKYRVRRTIQSGLGPMRELESTGTKDKSKVELRFGGRADDKIVNDRGGRGLYPNNTTIPLLERHKHIRVLTAEDEAHLADLDGEIAEKAAELRALQDNRAKETAKAWRRAGKIGISTLEEVAQS